MKGSDGLSVVTIVMHSMHLTHIGFSNEDCTVKAKPIRIHSGVFFSNDCVVEAGCQEARNWCMEVQISPRQCEMIVYCTESSMS